MQILMSKPKGRTVYRVFGTSYAGRFTRRDGNVVQCGHNHRTRKSATTGCLVRMKTERPGSCQDYRVEAVILVKGKREGGVVLREVQPRPP